MVIYELWNTRTRNLVDSFSTERAALSAAREIIEVNGPEYALHLALAQEDRRGNTRLIASGADLVIHIDRSSADASESPAGRKRTRRTRVAHRPADTRSTVYADVSGERRGNETSN